MAEDLKIGWDAEESRHPQGIDGAHIATETQTLVTLLRQADVTAQNLADMDLGQFQAFLYNSAGLDVKFHVEGMVEENVPITGQVKERVVQDLTALERSLPNTEAKDATGKRNAPAKELD